MKDKEKEKARREFLYRTKYLPAYLAFIILYPFGVEDLEGEVWRWIKGYENLYQISNFGRVKSFPRNGTGKEIKILRPRVTQFGYLRVYLYKNNRKKFVAIHRLVAEAFIPNPENKPEVNHKFGVKFDCYFENLEWTTKAENNEHSIKMGLPKFGVERAVSKLNSEQVRWIRNNYKPYDKKYGITAMAKKFNVGTSTIMRVINGKTYKNVE